MHEHRCLVCGYEGDVEFYPRDYMICGCCGTEFGYDDRVLTHRDLRVRWIKEGFPWFDAQEPRPQGWDPYAQLTNAGFAADVLDVLVPVVNTSDTTHLVPVPQFRFVGFQVSATA